MSAGLILLLVGMFVIARSVTKDDTGRTLIDRILGHPAQTA